MGTMSARGDFVRQYAIDDLRAFSIACLTAMDVAESDAEHVTNCLLFAERTGHPSHGIVRLPVYAKRVRAGVVKARATPRVEMQFGGLVVMDGDNGLGPVVGTRAMEEALAIAQSSGAALVAVRQSNHFGSAAFYTRRAMEAGLIGVAGSNAPPNMAPFGGKDRFLGTNPLSIAVPAGNQPPIVFDMASSVVARGNIILAAQANKPIPEGWALGPDGNPTTDAARALEGPVLPFGGAKGSAISLLIDVFSGVLSGAAYGRHLSTLENLNTHQNLGHFFAVLDPRRFADADEFRTRMDDLISQLKSTPTAPGFEEILVPGEIEARAIARSEVEGIPVSADVENQLKELAKTVGVEARLFDAPRGEDS
ncbi:MAG: Ldh family oxidoreductase [Spirochaetota bacterium]